MRRRITCISGIAWLLGAGLALAQGTPDDGLRTTLEEAAREVMQRYDIPGLSIAVTDQGRQRFYDFGTTSRQSDQPVSPDTLFELGSISKTFTATLAAWAQANGQLSLTARIDSYLPQLRDSRLGKLPVYHLATHTAGGFPLQMPEQVQNEQQLMAYFRAWQPQYLAGTQRSYANPSIGLLGVVAARGMKMPFDQAMEKQLFPALGLRDTWLQVPTGRLADYAQGYDKTNAPVRLNPGVLSAEAYGVKSSSRDLLRFVEAHLTASATGDSLQRALLDTRMGYFKVGPMTQAMIWEQYDAPLHLDALLQGNSREMVFESQRVEELAPPLPAKDDVWVNKTGSTNGFGGYVAFLPERKLGIVVLANRNYPNEERVRLAWRVLNELGCCSSL
ncbi:class C beta-lactamase [Pseudomonas sp. JDS28PS106]|uniref:class C beta-lactamase n=1 Tax=Pseudomonas sp. JDS28PS106 TaxID=2497235 RepID=UPI002FD015D7